MGLALSILVWSLGVLLVLFGVALVMPLRLELVVQKDAAWGFHAALRPFGRFGPRVALSSPAKSSEPVRHKRKSRRRPGRDAGRMIGAVVNLIGDILAQVRVARLEVDARFGLEDPSDTGQVFGVLCPLTYGCKPSQNWQVRIEPVFDRPILTGRAELVLSLIPIALLYSLAWFGWRVFGATR